MYRENLNAIVNAYNTGNFDEMDQYFTTETIRHAPASLNASANSLEELKTVIGDFRTAFPDIHLTMDEEFYEEGRSAIRWTAFGTNTGPGTFGTTGKKIKITGSSIAHYEDGKLKEEYVYFDTADFFDQLGLIEMSKAATG